VATKATLAQDGILVTGASRGIGMETALQLAARGFRVWASMRDPAHGAALEEEARRRGVKVETLRLDVTEPASVDTALAEIRARGGHLYGLVNNAGVTRSAYFEDFPEEEIRRVIEVNLFGVMNVTRRVLPLMREARRGRIVMLSSLGGRIASVSMAPYFASKFAIEGFAEALMQEVAPCGIQVVIVEPGIVATEIWDKEKQLVPAALNPGGPYYEYFCRAQAETDALVKTATVAPADVAAAITLAFTTRRPRLRYIVGWRGRLLISLRRHLPGEWFDRIYFREVIRRLTRPGAPRVGAAR
jgi:NAD(P)-dependent dehydrogenase (short-subunit alcohol dehydrogenase family)